jgi:hypothetical protein
MNEHAESETMIRSLGAAASAMGKRLPLFIVRHRKTYWKQKKHTLIAKILYKHWKNGSSLEEHRSFIFTEIRVL